MQPFHRLLTVAEVMDRLSLGRTTTYELIGSGELPSRRYGRAVRILESDLQRFITGPTTAYLDSDEEGEPRLVRR